MKAVIFYKLGSVTMNEVMEVYPRHKAVVDRYAGKGKVLAIGTYANPAEGSMGIFKDKPSAEAFDWTAGCIAVTDNEVDELYSSVIPEP